MRWLSQGAEVLAQRLRDHAATKAAEPLYDAVVIGSGYGGAVAALRLAQAGYKVCVLERGEELLPGEFPDDISRLPGHMRIERADRPGVIGERSGLFDIRLHGKITTLVGNALGGGSQINANVALRADPDVFRDARWPAELRSGYDPLDAYYTRVEDMLEVAPYPESWNCSKANELQRLEEPLNRRLRRHHWKAEAEPRATFYRPPLAISYKDGDNAHGVAQHKCTGCGDCVTGCNAGAKNTLTMNYLPEARRHGADLYTGATVVAVKPHEDPKHPEQSRCEVEFVYSDRDWSHVLAETGALEVKWLDETERRKELFSLSARIVVLAAGSIGSTEILLRSSYLHRIAFSPRLGSGFSGNGDALHFGFDQDQPVNAIGWGNRGPARDNPAPAAPPGPSIVGVLDVRAGLPTHEGVLIEDGIVPGPIAHATAEVVATAALLAQLDSCGLKREGSDEDPLAVNPDALARTQVYLGVGHDAARSRLRIRDGRAFVDWQEATLAPAVARQKDYLKVAEEVAKAVLVANPTSEPLPSALDSVLSGPLPTGTALVVHPLGGCPMGDHFEAGVVNHLGAVFNGASPRSVYSTLHVWDGAIVPSSLGVNPFMTIAALAERAAELVLDDLPPKAQPQRGVLPERPIVDPEAGRDAGADGEPRPREPLPAAFRFQETMEEVALDELKPVKHPMVLKLRMDVPDLGALLRDPCHRVTSLRGYVLVPGLRPHGRLRLEAGSSVELLVSRPGSRWRRLGRGLCAWWSKRGRDEVVRAVCDFLRGKRVPRDSDNLPPVKRLLSTIARYYRYACAVLRLANHAGERRLMIYRLNLRDLKKNKYRLHGVKTIDFARPSNQLLRSLTDLDSRLVRARDCELLRSCVLRLNLVALGEEDLPQVRTATDLPNALVALAGLGLLFARVLLKICLWDFRAPDYPSRSERSPLPEQRPLFVESVSLPGGRELYPRRYWIEAKRGGLAKEERETIPLALTRFEPPARDAHRTPLLMLPGFAQSTLALTCAPLKEDLVRHMLRQGFDVWLFDYRTSTALASSRDQCSLDDIAQYDIPAAVERILAEVEEEGWRPRWAQQAPMQIAAFGHCMGSATLAMSLLSGKLTDKRGHSRLRTAVLSQVPLVTIPSDYSRYRRHLGAFLRDTMGIDHVNFAADDGVDAREMLIDRLLATQPPVLGECPHEHERAKPRTDIATCKRVSGIIGPLYRHENVTRSHGLMHQYFGWGSMSVFMQITKFFEYQRLVSADGVNEYVSDENIRRHMNLPVALLHGEYNQVFKVESARQTQLMLNRVNGAGNCELIQARNYAHFDCLVGDEAHRDVYPRLSGYLRQQVLR